MNNLHNVHFKIANYFNEIIDIHLLTKVCPGRGVAVGFNPGAGVMTSGHTGL